MWIKKEVLMIEKDPVDQHHSYEIFFYLDQANTNPPFSSPQQKPSTLLLHVVHSSNLGEEDTRIITCDI